MELDLHAIGKRIRTQREYLGYSREKMAEYLGVTPKFCSDIELGLKGMSMQTLCNRSQILNLPVDYMLFGTENNTAFTGIIRLLSQLEPESIKYAEEILKNFVLATTDRLQRLQKGKNTENE